MAPTTHSPVNTSAAQGATTLLVDADFFFYRAASAAEYEMEYSPDLTVIAGSFTRGKQIVEQ